MSAVIRVLKLLPLLALALPAPASAQSPRDSAVLAPLADGFNFIIASDLGRNGYKDQKPVAEMMGAVADLMDVEFIVAAGDEHHFMGVASVQDPLWLTNFEHIYSHYGLMIPWYPILGNHEYRGNTQAVIDYSRISRRWQMPARYYSKVFAVNDSQSVQLFLLDTPPLIDKYRKDTLNYPDAGKQSLQAQLRWLEKELRQSKATWKIAVGHHPLVAGTNKEAQEQTDLQARLLPLLERYGVPLYVAGHIHNFQHLRLPSSPMEHFINGSAAEFRPIVQRGEMLFSAPSSGFTLCSLLPDAIEVIFLDQHGKVLYRYRVKLTQQT